jgi:hypothetical protein
MPLGEPDALGYLLGLVGAFVLGIGASASSRRILQRLSAAWRPVAGLAVAAVVAIEIWLWTRAVWPTIPDVESFGFAFTVACLCAGLAIATRRGRRTLAVLATVLAAGFVAGLAGLLMMGQSALSESPFDFEQRVFTAEDERAFVQRLRESRPAPDEPQILRLTTDNLNGLLTTALV